MKIKRIVSLFLALVLALSAVAVLGSCKKSEKGNHCSDRSQP